jgi:hypothetical protein
MQPGIGGLRFHVEYTVPEPGEVDSGEERDVLRGVFATGLFAHIMLGQLSGGLASLA